METYYRESLIIYEKDSFIYVQKFISNIHVRIEMCLKEDKVRFTFIPTPSSRFSPPTLQTWQHLEEIY